MVNEAFLRLVNQSDISWRDRAHFFALADKMMRCVLVDHARRTISSKRGGGAQTICLHELHDADKGQQPDLVLLDDASVDLEDQEPELARLVVMRYFGGLTREEIGAVLEVSPSTVARQWRTARAWLFAYLDDGGADAG